MSQGAPQESHLGSHLGSQRGSSPKSVLTRRLQASGRFAFAVALTLLGLLAVTFFIGRVVPIDPMIAIVGDRAPEHVVKRVRQELGQDLPLGLWAAVRRGGWVDQAVRVLGLIGDSAPIC